MTLFKAKIQGDTRIRAPRFSTEGKLVVKSKTIGTTLSYQLSTDDISSSGLLLSWDHASAIPFRENTLIEMEIDPGGSWLGKPLLCMGKVARRFSSDSDSRTKFGISIVQMDNDSLRNWEACIDSLSKKKQLNLLSKVVAA